jgi:hypothetical protein
MKEAHDMINTKWHEDWSHLAVGDPTDDTVVPNPVATVRALVDWVADIMAVLRAAGVAYPALADSTKGSTFWCVEHLHSKVAGPRRATSPRVRWPCGRGVRSTTVRPCCATWPTSSHTCWPC